jgi:hypothetical protein
VTTDITPEAVEHLCAIHEGYGQHGTVATLRALSAALTDKQDDAYLRGFAAGTKVPNSGEFTVLDSPELMSIRAALTASQAETAAAYEVVKVKPLVWRMQSELCEIADTPLGSVAVQDESHPLAPKRWGWWMAGSNEDDPPSGYGTDIESAKAAAQADYAASILAALPPATDAGEAAYHIETALAMARVQDGYARKTTCVGENIIFKANAKAQRQIAAYIKRMAAQSAAQIIAHDTTVRPMEWEESVKGRWIGTPPVKLGDLAFWIFQSEKGYIRHIPCQGAVVYPTLEAAKAAAQADYAASILAALATPADSKAALDRMIAETRADGRNEGMREAVGILESTYETRRS